ncbi:restriction endonuclease subunit S [Arthrospira platensis NCB002]|jgi:type I restriction enzyme S subunit|uniref:Type I restriction-modification system S subunit n=1 Tax=Limnospira platensis NIES-46 TaxID=1236695 RepID=A0A5M3TB09_LIMPL|nr:restriction endonuclease subunit S [Arthrospira platensis]MDF2211458.1 restriction endonuclease subunit S [Arthrospira platensis NCB002]BAI88504.1 type I restriction-modification system S subunit [Arthrospira platensis NIES-39]BDT10911.1 type I restriction-modification system S subunit [Arthrospira platensis NIES-39]GCE96107.1 type I restriction-modification system S subunit [Arthrospira platensis NIES-46]
MTWLQAKLKYVAHFAYGDALPKDQEREGDFKVFGSNGAYDNYGRANTQAPVIIVGRKGSYGKVNWSDHPCFASDTTFFIDATTTHHHLRWLFYLLQTLNLDQGTDEAAVPGLSRDDAYAKKVFIPPLGEQKAIAHYLDKETAKIDQLIEAKKRLLQLLDEKRRALITHTVTRGLNPDVPMRDSGVEWIGKIPKHWKCSKIKHHYEITLGKMLQNEPHSLEDVEVPYLKSQHVQSDRILMDNELPQMWANPWEIANLNVIKGDLLVCEGGEIGRSAIISSKPPDNCIIQNALHLVRPKPTGDVNFLKYLLNHAISQRWLDVLCNKATIAHFTVEKFSQMSIELPPLSEQKAIANYLDKETAKINQLRSAVRDTITLLQERRTSLITAAVTGQIQTKE